MNNREGRVRSIDIFRAVTMFLMIFVNDLPSLKSYPAWLGHMGTFEDGLGFSDVIFPAFLFIVGLSVPFAIEHRKKIGNDNIQILNHIVKRSGALVIMGFFAVNFEYINQGNLVYSKYLWEILMVFAFFLIWNNYRNHKIYQTIPSFIFQIAGVLILIFLASTYAGGTEAEPKGMRPHWWGILGIIGWAYFICTIIYFYLKDNIQKLTIVLLIFAILNISEFLLPDMGFIKITIIESAAHYTLVMGGVIASVLYRNMKSDNRYLGIMALAGIFFIGLGFAFRPLWGISKNLATPSWTFICTGISIYAFCLFYIISDKLNFTKWAAVLKPAGRSTLTTYLIPYYYYPIIALIGFKLPDFLITDGVGIIKSLVFSLMIIGITRVLELFRVRLKI